MLGSDSEFLNVVKNLAKASHIKKVKKDKTKQETKQNRTKTPNLSRWPLFALQILKFPYEIKSGEEMPSGPNISKKTF